MADIPSEENRIQLQETQFRAAVAESTLTRIGASINFLLDANENKTLKIVEFTSNAVWTVPADVSVVILEGCGGGGGPGLIRSSNGRFYEGGFGAPFIQRIVSVNPNSPANITIGNGGNGIGSGTMPQSGNFVSFGSSGQATIFSNAGTTVFPGGLGGCLITNMSVAFPNTDAVNIHIGNLCDDRSSGRRQYPNSAMPASYGQAANGFSSNSVLRPFSEGSSTGFLTNYFPPQNGSNFIFYNSTGVTFSYLGGSGPYGASTNGTQTPNSGAGGQVTITPTSFVGTPFTSSSGASGRLRIAYFSRF